LDVEEAVAVVATQLHHHQVYKVESLLTARSTAFFYIKTDDICCQPELFLLEAQVRLPEHNFTQILIKNSIYCVRDIDAGLTISAPFLGQNYIFQLSMYNPEPFSKKSNRHQSSW
jgi:hypothetical protein